MSSEYIKVDADDRNYSEVKLLNSQLNILNSLKNLKQYKKLRKEELLLKITLVSLVEETLNEISMLDKMLPRIHIKENTSQLITKEETQYNEESMSLNKELDLIKQKLLKLQED